MALADVFDAVASRRIYKEAMPFESVVELIREASGKHFDPDIVAAFMANLEPFREILQRYADTDESLAPKLAKLHVSGLA
jgi:putative two-component system response regulator